MPRQAHTIVRLLRSSLPGLAIVASLTASGNPAKPGIDMSGTWYVESAVFDGAKKIGEIKPVCVFQQAGDRFAGTCKGPVALGNASGKITGDRIEFQWTAMPYVVPNAAPSVANFKGVLKEDGSIEGLMKFGVSPPARFTATRQPPTPANPALRAIRADG